MISVRFPQDNQWIFITNGSEGQHDCGGGGGGGGGGVVQQHQKYLSHGEYFEILPALASDHQYEGVLSSTAEYSSVLAST